MSSNVAAFRFSFVLAMLVFPGAGSMLRAESFTFSNLTYPASTETQVTGINDLGQVVGSGMLPPYYYQGFLYEAGVFTSVNVPGLSQNLPQAINNYGTILTEWGGVFYEVNGTTVRQVAVPEDAGGNPTGLNDLGQIVGTYVSFSGNPGVHGYLSDGSTYQTLDRPGSSQTYATGINNAGQIVGYAYVNGTLQGFLYEGGTYQTISVPGAFQTFPQGINNLGEIVGTYQPNGPEDVHEGFVEIGGVFSTFSSPTGVGFGIAINDLGQVAGTWFYSDNSPYTGFVGTPMETSAPTPEPGTLGLVGTGLVGLAGAVWRRCHDPAEAESV